MLKHTKKLIAGLLSLVMCAGLAAPAMADDSGRYLDITLIGDSYTAGNGAGSYYGPKNTYRSSRNWGHVYADWLNEQGVQTTVRNLAVSGGVTKDVLEKQLPLLDPTSDLVMLTIGGNDIKFEDIVKYCFVLGIRSYNGCEGAINYAKKTFPQTRDNIVRIFEEVQKKVADDARIILVGYPLLSIESDYTVSGWFWGKYPAAAKIREFGQFATVEQQKMVDEWNANPQNKVKITFVPTELHFAGHEPDPDTSKQNPYRWLNEMLEDEGEAGPDGVIVSKPTGLLEVASWYHPNITGHREIAGLLKDSVGVPATVRTMRSTARDIDVVFLLETTTMTGEKMPELVAQIQRVTREITASSTGAGATPRFALVTYRDVELSPSAQGAAFRSASETNAPASSSPEAVQPTTRLLALGDEGMDSALASVSPNGPHARTSLATAVGEGIAQFDRPTARKAVIVLGDLDAAGSDPAQWDRLANAAFAQGTAEVIGIDVNGETGAELAGLARRTGGYVTSSETLKPLILPEPVASATLPDLARVGDTVVLDASASSVEGARLIRYEWDTNGDGVFDVISDAQGDAQPASSSEFTWTEAYNGLVTLRVTDQYNRQASVEVPIRVTPDGDLIDEGDNCPEHPNPDQVDTDLDGIGDVCDETPNGVHAVPDNAPVVDLPIAPIGVVPDNAPTVELPVAEIGMNAQEAPFVDLPVKPVEEILLGDMRMLVEQMDPAVIDALISGIKQAGADTDQALNQGKTQVQMSAAQPLARTGSDFGMLLALAGVLMFVGVVGRVTRLR